MLLYENGRFHFGGISFAIPNGFFLETDPEMSLKDGIEVYGPDKSFSVELSLYAEEKCTKSFLRDVVKEMECPVIERLSYVELNGLHGHHVTYGGEERTSYYEARFNLPGDYEDYTQFSILTTTKGDNVKIQDVKQRKDYQELIQSIQRE